MHIANDMYTHTDKPTPPALCLSTPVLRQKATSLPPFVPFCEPDSKQTVCDSVIMDH